MFGTKNMSSENVFYHSYLMKNQKHIIQLMIFTQQTLLAQLKHNLN